MEKEKKRRNATLRAIALAQLVLVSLVPGGAGAGLIGDTISGDLKIKGNSTNYWSAATAEVVEPGVEFSHLSNALITADFGDEELVINIGSLVGNTNLYPGLIVQTFTGLDWSGGLGITGLTQVSSSFPVALAASFTSDSIIISYDLATLGPSQGYTASFALSGGKIYPNPEPSTFLLVGLGLGAAGWAGRRSRGRQKGASPESAV